MEIRKMFMAYEAGAGVAGGYSDVENIEYETVVDSLKNIRDRVNVGSELSKEIEKLGSLAEELIVAWNSPTSKRAKSTVEDMKVDLRIIQEELNVLIAEVEKYNAAARAIDEGKQPDAR